jgi:hypothetical protein
MVDLDQEILDQYPELRSEPFMKVPSRCKKGNHSETLHGLSIRICFRCGQLFKGDKMLGYVEFSHIPFLEDVLKREEK